MSDKPNPAEAFIRKRFQTFRELSATVGEEAALQQLFSGYGEQVKQRMAPYLAAATLAEGLRSAVAEFSRNGWDMEVVDISTNGMDAALEIQKVCPARDICREYGYEKPCFLICDPDGPAIRSAFPELRAVTLCRQADGDCVCLFKFERALH